MMMAMAKNIGRATCVAASRASSSLSGSVGFSSRMRRMFSSMTMAPSTMMPKSMAPSDSRFAGMSVKCIKMNAMSSAIGIVMATIMAAPRCPKIG